MFYLYRQFHIVSVFCSFEDPWNFGMDPDPRIHTADYWIRILLIYKLFANYFLKVHLYHFSNKSQKEEEVKTVWSMFLLRYYFCLMIEGPGAGAGPV